MADYSILQLQEMIRLAKQLGFWDDVEHWTKILKEKLSDKN